MMPETFMWIRALCSVVAMCILRWVHKCCIDVGVKLKCMPTRINKAIASRCPTFYKPYRPNAMLSSIPGIDHLLQSAYLVGVPPASRAAVRLQLVKLPDGGSLGLQWLNESEDEDIPTTRHIVVSMPPVGECSPFKNLNGILCHEIIKRLHYRVVQVVYQGLGGLPLTSRHLPGTGYCGLSDTGEAIRAVHEAFPEAKILVLGCSIGSAIFTRWAGANPEVCKRYKVSGAVLCAHGFSAQETTERGDKMFLSIGGKNVVRIWKEQLSTYNTAQLDKLDGVDGFSRNALFKARLSGEWDDALLSIYGYTSREDMFLHCDAVYVMKSINFPSLYINAEDDPVCPAARMRRQEKPDLLNSPMAMLLSTRRGGHLGWHDGFFASSSQRQWIRGAVCEFLQAVADIQTEEAAVQPCGTSEVGSLVTSEHPSTS